MIHDVVIVGSGPAGDPAAIYAARAQLNPVILAGSVTAGGALMNTTEVENYPGFVTGIMGPELMTQMQEQAERFGADVRYEDVTALELTGEVKRITTDDAVSTGSEYRHLGIDGEERLSGHGVSYCATCDGFFFKDQDIVVVGGGDSAMEEATFLTRFARSVTVVHRRDELRASAVMAKRAQEDPKISFAWNSRVVELHGEDSLTAVTLEDTVTGDRRRLEATGLFVAIGQVPRSELVADVLELDEAHAVHFVARVRPRACLLLNVMRDQLDRFGEIDYTASLLHSIAKATSDVVVLNGHSTGGLQAVIWAADHPGTVDALVLNSPWLDLRGSALVRSYGSAFVDLLSRRDPERVIGEPGSSDEDNYVAALHRRWRGEWDWDLALKPAPSFPVRAGFLAGIRRLQREVHHGLGIRVPILVCCSTASGGVKASLEEAQRSDVVLDVEQIIDRSQYLGDDVTVRQIPEGVHDLALSGPLARAEYLQAVMRWLDNRLH